MTVGYKDFDCQVGNGAFYKGDVNVTRSGKSCQNWKNPTVHFHNFTKVGDHNKCRNPDGVAGAWCYTTLTEKIWEYCNIRHCHQFDRGIIF